MSPAPPCCLLQAGIHKFVIIHQQFTGAASVVLRWQSGAALVDLPWGQVTPFPPSSPVDVAVSVNGQPAAPDCPPATLDLTAAGGAGAPLPGELPAAVLPAGRCSYVYSSYRTPTLTVPVPLGYNGVLVNRALAAPPPASIPLVGALLGGLSPASYSVQLGGLALAVQSVTGDASLQNLTVGLPALPGGGYPLQLLVAGFGYARNASATTNATSIIR